MTAQVTFCSESEDGDPLLLVPVPLLLGGSVVAVLRQVEEGAGVDQPSYHVGQRLQGRAQRQPPHQHLESDVSSSSCSMLKSDATTHLEFCQLLSLSHGLGDLLPQLLAH